MGLKIMHVTRAQFNDLWNRLQPQHRAIIDGLPCINLILRGPGVLILEGVETIPTPEVLTMMGIMQVAYVEKSEENSA